MSLPPQGTSSPLNIEFEIKTTGNFEPLKTGGYKKKKTFFLLLKYSNSPQDTKFELNMADFVEKKKY